MVGQFSGMGMDDASGRKHPAGSVAAEVNEALDDAYDINASRIKVTMLGTYVVLEGFVGSTGDIGRAIEIAEEVVGEGKVRSRLLRG